MTVVLTRSRSAWTDGLHLGIDVQVDVIFIPASSSVFILPPVLAAMVTLNWTQVLLTVVLTRSRSAWTDGLHLGIDVQVLLTVVLTRSRSAWTDGLHLGIDVQVDLLPKESRLSEDLTIE